mmetsp:Transcript_15931/g.30840  ORF Transcript_15931/g.30840 Transcript_15931/m.30840 type:complete len:576 (-) Transcript_15931:113-1840(-)|eukprot:CAMPEP_0171509436 /NCGR_PEP_ID=MMETSP0958-20121227/14776_1 /TAXON_ID=87120 /ORGANISM="Aurantiochytrium limacinum, Strain ATCCMYA-1381" /LENGTH=575 /DNA_ID=CAMNT_0012046689 /DNA_START=275 /DNA_END=2002 /DNA_ORIENTATION=-
MGVPSIFSFRGITLSLFLGYIAFVSHQLYYILNPGAALASQDFAASGIPTWDPSWSPGQTFKASVWLTQKPTRRTPRSSSTFQEYRKDKQEDTNSGKTDTFVKLWGSEPGQELVFDKDKAIFFAKDFNLSRAATSEFLWDQLSKNKIVYAVFCLQASHTNEQCVSTPLVKHIEVPVKRPTRYLVQGWPVLGQFVPDDACEVENTPASESETNVGFWTPIAAARLVADWTQWPRSSHTPAIVRGSLPIDPQKPSTYLPVIYSDQLGLTKEKLIQINTTNEVLPLRIEIGPMSIARWQFNAHMEESLKLQQQFGASEKDIDDMRYVLTETDPTLLGVTLFVSLTHLLLDVLAFRSDIAFWASTKSTRGLAIRPLVIELVSQIIILAYLHEESASLLVLGPSAVGVLVQIWKVHRAFCIGGSEDTSALDSSSTLKLALALVPMILAYAVYSLVRMKHPGFYSWAVGSLASCVYALGFVMMTPQIFINYKLKSVAQLPWEYFIYKATNTFIDDLFAFIIRMPTMHRAAVFRDDLVFFVYMYQRWIYPVDKSRREGLDTEEFDDLANEADNKRVESKKTK